LRPMNTQATQNRLSNSLIIALFLTAILTPFIIWVLQTDISFSEVEKRELNRFPELQKQSIPEFTHAFDAYFQDHFGLREWFINRYHREASKRFNVSGVPDVVKGRDGWLYLSHNSMLDDLKGRLGFSDPEKKVFWNHLITKETWLDEQNIAYIFLIAPNKQSIYPEYLPSHFRSSPKSSRLDELLSNRPVHGGASLLDVRSNLRLEKSNSRLYNKSDSHWNAQGAYLAYLALMKRNKLLFPEIQMQEKFNFIPEWKNTPGGDLAEMIGKKDSTVEQQPVLNTTTFASTLRPIEKPLMNFFRSSQLQVYQTTKTNRSLKVLVLHDSFFGILSPFISESYGDVLFVNRYQNDATSTFLSEKKLKELVSLLKPDLIIDELVERNLPNFIPKEM